jgi:hypothetical protein
MPAEIINSSKNFYYCSECKNASNKPEGIPHASTCSLQDTWKQTQQKFASIGLRAERLNPDTEEWE